VLRIVDRLVGPVRGAHLGGPALGEQAVQFFRGDLQGVGELGPRPWLWGDALEAQRDKVRAELIRAGSAAKLSQAVIADVLGLSQQRVGQLANAS